MQKINNRSEKKKTNLFTKFRIKHFYRMQKRNNFKEEYKNETTCLTELKYERAYRMQKIMFLQDMGMKLQRVDMKFSSRKLPYFEFLPATIESDS